MDRDPLDRHIPRQRSPLDRDPSEHRTPDRDLRRESAVDRDPLDRYPPDKDPLHTDSKERAVSILLEFLLD